MVFCFGNHGLTIEVLFLYIRANTSDASPTPATKASIAALQREKREMEFAGEKKAHFILVHGACHGAWCWYKLTPLLVSKGHRVTALDLSASGDHPDAMEDVRTFSKYSKPLLDAMAALPPEPEEKVIMVGHSLGGINLALAMETFPHKIAAAVFLSAFMPDLSPSPAHVLNMFIKDLAAGYFLDTQFVIDVKQDEKPLTLMLFGPRFLSEKLYQLSPLQDLSIAKASLRVSSLFMEDLSSLHAFKPSTNRYGSVHRVFIVCTEDIAIRKEFQQWMIHNYSVKQVMEIKGADHMVMLSKPQELCKCLLDVAKTYL